MVGDILLRGRSIPARAGETVSPLFTSRKPPVHPRACGGNSPRFSALRSARGPSPRVRGKLDEPAETFVGLRSIPARAGETTLRIGREVILRVPSPRVRGKHRRRQPFPFLQGSIPARAGETMTRRRVRTSGPVHPRACGGNRDTVRVAEYFYGPSPRVRGKLLGAGGWSDRNRSIPARAGETL